MCLSSSIWVKCKKFNLVVVCKQSVCKLFELFCNVSDQSKLGENELFSSEPDQPEGKLKQNLPLQSHQLPIHLVHHQSGQPRQHSSWPETTEQVSQGEISRC